MYTNIRQRIKAIKGVKHELVNLVTTNASALEVETYHDGEAFQIRMFYDSHDRMKLELFHTTKDTLRKKCIGRYNGYEWITVVNNVR